MQFFTATLFAFIAAVSAQNVSYTTVTNTDYVTYCPVSGIVTHEGSTYTNTETEGTTMTLTCSTGCAQVVPIYTTSSVICNTCAPAVPTVTPTYPARNATVPAFTNPAGLTVPAQTTALQAGAGKAVVFSGASLAGLLGFAAYVL